MQAHVSSEASRQQVRPPLPPGIEERFEVVSGHSMRYLRAGSGRPLLLVHGLLGYTFSWRFNLTALATHATLYAVDLLGTGFSDRAELDCSLPAMARYLTRFVNQLNIGQFDLLGSSHGGALAITLAGLDPSRIRRLILCSPANPWAPRGRWLAPFLSATPVRPFVPRMTRLKWLRRLQLGRMYGDRRRISPGTLEGYCAPLAIPGTIEHVQQILCGWNKDLAQLPGALARIGGIPTLLLWGDHDRVVSPASAEPLRSHFHNVEYFVFEGVGHLPYEEVPEAFNRVVTEFLTH